MESLALEFEVMAEGLVFPEGPVIMDDGSVVLVEIGRKTLVRIDKSGNKLVIADLGGGPNGVAIGPDGAAYVCNNGRASMFVEYPGGVAPVISPPDIIENGRIQRVDLKTGKWKVLYDHCGDFPLSAPNDIVFDQDGGFYFTTQGWTNTVERKRTLGALYYAKIDGSSIVEVDSGMLSPNGVGLSPDQQTVYVSDTIPGHVFAYDLEAPGKPKDQPGLMPGVARFVAGVPGFTLFDSLAVTASGNVCVGCLVNGGIMSISPDGQYQHYSFPDPMVTNICFGGDDMRDAYLTFSGTGKLVKCRWPEPGLKLNFNA